MKASERGAIFVIVAITIVVLMGLAAFAVDYGMFWMARGQAQTAADAGALAGATALAYDDPTWPAPAGGQVELSAKATAAANPVGGGAGVANVSSVCPAYLTAPTNTNCIRVDVYKNGQFASATMPTYFANAFGVASQGTRATATAQVSNANGSGCMRPWFVVDKTPSYCVICSPSDIGATVTFHQSAGPSAYGQLDVGSGGNAIRDAIEHCVAGLTFSIGETVATKPGNTLGPEKQGIDQLLSWDPDSGGVHIVYTPSGGGPGTYTSAIVVGGCAAAGTCACPTAAQCPYGGTMSPRIVQAAICDPTEPACSGTATGNGTITITNILSFFITGYTVSAGNLDINAVLISSGGEQVPGGSAGPGKSFVITVRLVQ